MCLSLDMQVIEVSEIHTSSTRLSYLSSISQCYLEIILICKIDFSSTTFNYLFQKAKSFINSISFST